MTLAGHHLRKSWGTSIGLSDVSVALEPGTITALIGPSGSGKTTLIRALSLLDLPDEGAVEIDGETFYFPQAYNQKSPPSPWPKVTVVFQQLFLWPHLSLAENILLPVRARHLLSAAKKKEIHDMVQQFGLMDALHRFPNEASIGQRQRVALLRALALDSSYLLLDEITSSLDVEQVSVLLRHMRDWKSKGVGMLLVSHHLGFARQVADRVAFLEFGKLIASGGIDVLTQPDNERVRRFLSVTEADSNRYRRTPNDLQMR